MAEVRITLEGVDDLDSLEVESGGGDYFAGCDR